MVRLDGGLSLAFPPGFVAGGCLGAWSSDPRKRGEQAAQLAMEPCHRLRSNTRVDGGGSGGGVKKRSA